MKEIKNYHVSNEEDNNIAQSLAMQMLHLVDGKSVKQVYLANSYLAGYPYPFNTNFFKISGGIVAVNLLKPSYNAIPVFNSTVNLSP